MTSVQGVRGAIESKRHFSWLVNKCEECFTQLDFRKTSSRVAIFYLWNIFFTKTYFVYFNFENIFNVIKDCMCSIIAQRTFILILYSGFWKIKNYDNFWFFLRFAFQSLVDFASLLTISKIFRDFLTKFLIIVPTSYMKLASKKPMKLLKIVLTIYKRFQNISTWSMLFFAFLIYFDRFFLRTTYWAHIWSQYTLFSSTIIPCLAESRVA